MRLVYLPFPSVSIGKTEYIKLVKNGQEDEPYEVSRVWVKRKLVVPPNTTVNVKVSTSLTSGEDIAISSSNHNKGLLMANVLVTGKSEVLVNLMNDSNEYIYLKKNHILGFAVAVAEILEQSDSSPADDTARWLHYLQLSH